ncbi:50S ribosomal protein L32 [Candidatus Kaiserbacteria bacterium]|nr:50S ribosomal protein L32 [Candidatus Kaiserbacteria bacterium]MCB9811748.1 50S ribosomal protein L32 [Candidatus Nomurabacteria bacterium]
MVIRMRHNRSQSKSRRSHHALSAPTLATCKNCGAHHRPHHMCLECGFYNGRQVMDLAAKKEARTARMQAKREAIRAQAESVAETESTAVAEAAPAKEKKEESK